MRIRAYRKDEESSMDTMERVTAYGEFFGLLRTGDIVSAARAVSEAGIGTVEFLELQKHPIVTDTETAKRFRRVLTEHGLSVACFSATARLWAPSLTEGEMDAQEHRLMRLADAAAEVGSPYLHHTLVMTSDHSAPYEAVLDRVAERAIRIARYARRLGLRVLYEPQGMYFNGSDGFRGLYRRVKAECPEVGVCADVGNPMFVDEDPVRFVKEFACEALHVHVKDYRGSDGNGDRTRGGRFLIPARIGTGEAHVAECLSALAAAGYTGYFGVEDDGDEALRASAELCSAWL